MLTVAVIEGGYSHEKQISLQSAATVEEHLDKSKYTTVRVRIDEKGWFGYTNDGQLSPIDKNDFSVIINGKTIHFDFAFIVIHGTPGEDGKLQAYFDMLEIPYSTCNHFLSTLTFNKFSCNQYLKSFGISVAEAVLLQKGQPIREDEILNKVGLPCFVKPNDGGSSFGITKVATKEELEKAIALAFEHGTQVLIESFLEGREVTNGVYRNKNGITVLPITEIITQNDFFDFDAKYAGESEEVTPASLPLAMNKKVKELTYTLYDLLNLSGIARMDYILQDDTPTLIEINTVPGQSAQSIIPQMAKAEGIPLNKLFDEVIEFALIDRYY